MVAAARTTLTVSDWASPLSSSGAMYVSVPWPTMAAQGTGHRAGAVGHADAGSSVVHGKCKVMHGRVLAMHPGKYLIYIYIYESWCTCTMAWMRMNHGALVKMVLHDRVPCRHCTALNLQCHLHCLHTRCWACPVGKGSLA